MNDIVMIPLGENHNRQMLDIQKASPINANGLKLYFDKSPDIFGLSRLKYYNGQHLGFFASGRLVGYGSLGFYDAFVQQRQETVFTAYNFYLLPEARGKQLPALAVRHMLQEVAKTNANFGIALTLKGNRAAESYIGGNTGKGVPASRIIDELIVNTILFSKKRKNTSSYIIRNATSEDIPEMVRLLKAEHQHRDFGLIFTEEGFKKSLELRQLQPEQYYVAVNRRGEIKGVALAWDCNRFKRTTVVKYAPAFYPVMAAYRIMQQFVPMAPFPAPGRSFHELTITDCAAEERDPVIMNALLCEIYHRHHNQNYHFMNWAGCATDPLLKAAQGFWRKEIRSHIIFTSMDPERFNIKTKLPYIDIAFL